MKTSAKKTAKKKTEKVVVPAESKKIGLFDFLNSVNAGNTGEDLLKDCTADAGESAQLDAIDKAYSGFMINRGLSFFVDTILYANAMNERHYLPPKMQYDFYRNALRPRKRFSKWFKALDDSADVELIKAEYGYSSEKARDAFALFTPEALERLRQKHDKGGKTK